MIYPNYNNYYPQQTLNQYAGAALSPQPGLKGRPVSSIEEARAANIDFDGSLFIFPDIANKKIYTKQINLDGTATLNQYDLTIVPTSNPISQDTFVTREEFDSTMKELKEMMEEKLKAPAKEVKQQPVVF